MAHKDNREFISALDRTGDVVHIRREVDWDLEAGAIVRRAGEMQAPAPLFEKLKDYPPDFRILGAPMATTRRVAVAFGLSPDTGMKGIQDEYQRRRGKPIKPVLVKDGPCKENRLLGDEVDLYRFPVPMIHEGDGGRYIGTWHLVVTKDPDSDWTNWGMYRVMLWNKRHVAALLTPSRNVGDMLYGKYLPKKQPMPIAIVIGADPISSLTAGTFFGRGQSEADYSGGLRGEPVELVKCETIDLLVPAHAEIVLEGLVMPEMMVPEGPFGEFTGYRSGMGPRHLIDIKAITYRNNPIFTMTCMGIPWDDSNLCQCLTLAADIKRLLLRRGLPVTDVCLPVEAAQHLVVVGVRTSEWDRARQIKDLIRPGELGLSKIIVVDEDVDVFNLAQVLHAWATKCHPGRGITITQDDFATPLTPYLTDEERAKGKAARALFDSTWPLDWAKDKDIPPRSSFQDIYPEEIQKKVVKNWAAYGYKS